VIRDLAKFRRMNCAERLWRAARKKHHSKLMWGGFPDPPGSFRCLHSFTIAIFAFENAGSSPAKSTNVNLGNMVFLL